MFPGAEQLLHRKERCCKEAARGETEVFLFSEQLLYQGLTLRGVIIAPTFSNL